MSYKKSNPNGQASMANSEPVVISSNQSAVPVSLPVEGVVSVVNSTIVNLGVGAVFTGTSEDLTIYSNIKVSVFSSHASATDGLSIQQSIDGTNWDNSDLYTIPATTYRSFSVSVNSKFFRIVYTNGATLTTSLRIQTLFHKSDKQASSVRPQDARSNENDFIETLGFLMGYNGTSWDRLRSSTTKGLDVNPTELRAATTTVTATAATGTAVTLTLPAVSAQFHYITSIDILIYATAARTGAATPLVVTTTNITGSPAFTFETAQAIGTNTPIQGYNLTTPLKSTTVNTATTIVAPIATSGIWRITVTYFTAA